MYDVLAMTFFSSLIVPYHYALLLLLFDFLSFPYSILFQFEEGGVYNRETMLKKLKGCDSWLCFNCNPAKIKQQAEVWELSMLSLSFFLHLLNDFTTNLCFTSTIT